MGFRKIIGFGGSSFVVSLPKEWIDSNGLKKGDTLTLEAEGNTVKLSPISTQSISDSRDINLEFDGDIRKLKSQLIHAYIDSYNTINIIGKNLFNYLDDVKAVLEGLVALGIIQRSQTKITLKDFLDIHAVSIHDTLRRVDRIVFSMSEDVRDYLSGKNPKVSTLLDQKEKDVNRLTKLLFKALKRCFNPNDRTILKLDLGDVFYYWEMTLFIEKVGDQLRLIPKIIKPGVAAECLDLYDKTMLHYTEAMKSNFSKDYELAMKIVSHKKVIYNEANRLVIKLPSGQGYSSALEKIKNINDFSGNLAKTLLRLKFDSK